MWEEDWEVDTDIIQTGNVQEEQEQDLVDLFN